MTALLGANGAGKSSTVLAIAGVLPISGGHVRLHSKTLTGQTPEMVRSRGVAVVTEGHFVLESLSVRDNLLAACSQMRQADIPSAVQYVLTLFPELAGIQHQSGRTLSGGQKQMLCLAQALIIRPQYLIVDELSLGLAPMVLTRLVGVLRDLAAQGMGILLIEQFTKLALSVSRDVYVMTRGRITYSGSASALLTSPDVLHAAYLGSPS